MEHCVVTHDVTPDDDPLAGAGASADPSDDASADAPLDQGFGFGLTLQRYAKALRLPPGVLEQWGLSTMWHSGSEAVRIPYLDEAGELVSTRFKRSLSPGGLVWKRDSQPCLYGLNRLPEIRRRGWVVLSSTEDDAFIGWHHDLPTLAVPNWQWQEWRDAELLRGVDHIYVLIPPGDPIPPWLDASAIKDRVSLILIAGFHELPVGDPERFMAQWQVLHREGAQLWADHVSEQQDKVRDQAWQECQALASCRDILAKLDLDLKQTGLVGEGRATRLLYLATTSRVFFRPVNVCLEGTSSTGKSLLWERVLPLFPKSAVLDMSAASEKALYYTKESLSHRMLVLAEAAALKTSSFNYMIRTLLSERRLVYHVAVKDPHTGGWVDQRLEKLGPTGLILTTTGRLHPENATRMLSVPATETAQQTRAIVEKTFDPDTPGEDELEGAAWVKTWQALQEWLEAGLEKGRSPRVVFPLGRALRLLTAAAPRMRRDSMAIRTLIHAHAWLHQLSRERDERGRIIATLDDYAAIHDLVADLLSTGAERAVSPDVGRVLKAINDLAAEGQAVTQKLLTERLGEHKVSVHRWVKKALEAGLVEVAEKEKGSKEKVIKLLEPYHEGGSVLPTPEQLWARAQAMGIVATQSGLPAPSEPEAPASEETPAQPEPSVPEEPAPPAQKGKRAQKGARKRAEQTPDQQGVKKPRKRAAKSAKTQQEV
jgi:hypothetical protein